LIETFAPNRKTEWFIQTIIFIELRDHLRVTYRLPRSESLGTNFDMKNVTVKIIQRSESTEADVQQLSQSWRGFERFYIEIFLL